LTALPRHLLAAVVLVWDADGRILVVQTHNRDYPILPGGLVEEGESPAQAARRECREELGIDVPVGRLLAVQHLPGDGRSPDSVQFVFDSSPLPAGTTLVLQAVEIAHATWMTQAVHPQGERGRARLAAAPVASDDGTTAYLD
jgi:8-oxo-dGTP diphosphatase